MKPESFFIMGVLGNTDEIFTEKFAVPCTPNNLKRSLDHVSKVMAEYKETQEKQVDLLIRYVNNTST